MVNTQEEILYFTNYNLSEIVTPVKADRLRSLLEDVGYDMEKTQYLFNEFTEGFSLCYQGPLSTGKRLAPNLKLRVGSKVELWNKMMKEVELGRFAGPYDEPPFDNFVQSPVGLVPKDKGLKTRLIFHLSYPKKGESVNSGIPRSKCTVKYPDFEEAIKLCLKEGVGCKIAKSDMSSAFRHVPLRRDQWHLLVIKPTQPETHKIFYFMDKCLLFGSSISCAIFQAISDAIAFIVQKRMKKENVNYLDDYLFAAALKLECDRQVQEFLAVCEDISFPVALEKTYWGMTLLVFLGLLLDSEKQMVCIPQEKIEKALEMIQEFLNKKNRKATVLQFQKLCGHLNFLCRCVLPDRVFLRRLYAQTSNPALKPHHHVKISAENRLDPITWQMFLSHQSAYCRNFMQPGIADATILDMYSDASRNFNLGFGAYCDPEWMWGQWDFDFCTQVQPSIEYLELFGVTATVLEWLKLFPNRRIILFCDNEAVVSMINNSTSSCKNCMILLRMIILESLVYNSRVYARYVRSKDNGKADALSRLQFKRFRSLADGMNEKPTSVPTALWPFSKIWSF